MKHLFFLLLLTATFSSCKKSSISDLGSVDKDPKFEKKLQSKKHQSGYITEWQYNADGSIKSVTEDLARVTSVTYTPGFALTHKYPGTVYEMKNVSKNHMGRVATAELWHNGVLTDNNQYTYNAEGYLIQKKVVKVSSGIINTTDHSYENGNLVSSKSYQNGILRYSHQYSYYTDKLNKFNVDIYDQFDHKHMIGSYFGKLNRHLLKSWSYTSFPANASHSSEYSYTLDADGYPVKQTHVDDGYSSFINFVFQ